ncbi:hypothetical protein HK102_006531 [Quaeritorhiza haematococci]|nr:hypothetical protein HK102_006531 [Quaeritorhiza haematococci]
MSAQLCNGNNVCQIFLDHIIPALGVITATAIFFSPWKAMQNVLKTKDLGSTNPIPFPMMMWNAFVWVNYGLLVKNYYVISPNIVGIITGT